jgi:PAS domain S-box-containing protein
MSPKRNSSGRSSAKNPDCIRRPDAPAGDAVSSSDDDAREIKPRRAEKDWQQTFDAIPHFVALVNPDLELIRLNKAGCECLGARLEEVVGKNCCQVVHDRPVAVHGCPCVESVRTLKPTFSELTFGEKQYVATASPVFDESGRLSALVHTIRDVTQRKEQEEELRRYREELEDLVKERTFELSTANRQLQNEISERKRAEEEIQRSYRSQSILNELLRLSLEDVSLEVILERTIDLIVSTPGLALDSRGAIFLVTEEPRVLIMKAQRGLELPLQTICARVPFGKCLCGRAAESGRVEYAGSTDNRHENRYRGMISRGHYCVPIVSSDRRVLGVFTLYLKQDHSPDEKEREFLGAVANVLAGIIERRRAEETLMDTAELLKIEREALERKNIALSEVMGRIDSEKNALKHQLVTNVEQAIIPTLLRLKESCKPFQKPIFEMLEKDLREIASPFVSALEQGYAKLSPRELEVCRLIKNGMTSKEIAEVLNLSLLTVYKYRDLIRKKLGLVKNGSNLQTFLRSL